MLQVQLIGGARDGDIIPYQGKEVAVLSRKPAFYSFEPVPLTAIDPTQDTIKVDHYVLRMGHDGELYYVLYQASKAWG